MIVVAMYYGAVQYIGRVCLYNPQADDHAHRLSSACSRPLLKTRTHLASQGAAPALPGASYRRRRAASTGVTKAAEITHWSRRVSGTWHRSMAWLEGELPVSRQCSSPRGCRARWRHGQISYYKLPRAHRYSRRMLPPNSRTSRLVQLITTPS